MPSFRPSDRPLRNSSASSPVPSHKRVPIDGAEHLVRRGAEIGRIELVGAHLAAGRIAARALSHRPADFLRHGKQVGAAGTERGGALAAQNDPAGELLVESRVLRRSAPPRERCRTAASAPPRPLRRYSAHQLHCPRSTGIPTESCGRAGGTRADPVRASPERPGGSPDCGATID